MCGITGFWSNQSVNQDDLKHVVVNMANTIQHRGPDDGGVWVDAQIGMALGHRRLSILDLSMAGHQPMLCHTGRYCLVFNGEIYNHLALRLELEQLTLAPSWRGHSDTETLLASFVALGVHETLQRMVGMFALALWDRQERRLILVRDRFGEKPLYYGWVGGALVFGSELKALRAYPGFNPTINRDVLALYLEHNSVPDPYSIYDNIFKLKPGHILSIDEACLFQKKLTPKPYWQLSKMAHQGLREPITDEIHGLSLLETALSEAVDLQAVADVPLGAFLSGGVDSSLIVALMQKQTSSPIKTFTVGFDDPSFDESAHAQLVANHLGTEHHKLPVRASDAQDLIAKLPTIYDEPFADSSQIPTYLLSQLARQHVKVILSGDGGDELFGGYGRHVFGSKIWPRMAWMPHIMRQGLGGILEQVPVELWNVVAKNILDLGRIQHFGSKIHKIAHRFKHVKTLEDLYRSFVVEWPQSLNVVLGSNRLSIDLDNAQVLLGPSEATHQMMLWDTLGYMSHDIITKVERASMNVGLETRMPFLDHRVAELAWKLPLIMKLRHKESKWALRQILYKHVPRALIEGPKMGFAVPVGAWLRGLLRPWVEALIEPSRLSKEGYLNPDPIHQIWKQHLSGRYDWTQRLWVILMFQLWLEEHH